MSRVRTVTVPFVQGQNEGIDDKLLPDGVLARLRNARFTKTGELALRTGWRPVDDSIVGDDGTLIGGDHIFQDLYSVNGSLVGLLRGLGAPISMAAYTRHNAAVPWTQRFSVPVCPITDVRVRGNVPDLPADVRRVSCAVTADGVWGAVLQQTSAASVLRVFRIATDETTFYDDLASGSVPRKLVSFGSTFGLVENTGAVLRLRAVDPTASSSMVSSSTTTLVTATVTDFDAATAIKDTNTPVGVHVAYVEAGAVKYAQFTSAGSQTGSTKTVVASGATRCAVASNDTLAHVVYDDGSSELQLLTFAASGSFTTSAGPTAVNAGSAVTAGQFLVGCSSTHAFVASGLSASRTCLVNKVSNAHSSNTRTDHDSSSLVGGIVFADNTTAVFVARGRSASSALNDVALVDVDQPWLVPAYSTGTTFAAAGVSAPFAVCQNLAGDVLAAYARLSDTSNTTAKAASTAGAALLTRQAAVLSFSSFSAARRPGAVLAGVLHLAGGMLTQYGNGGVVENGLPKPVIFSLTASNSTGTLANGTYQYRAIVVWTDRLGRLHRSAVSDPLSLAVSGSDDTVTALVHVAKTLRRDANLVTQPKVELYRTEAGPGELFYLVASTVCGATDDEVSLVDLLPDSSIIDNRRLYTEGEFGAVSGALDVAPASASDYAAAVRDRLVLGAGPGLQYSQLLLPEEPTAFTQPGVSGPGALVYQDTVEEDLTAVFSLDDQVVAATRSALYVVSATDGPNLAGVGEFPSPARLPSPVGVYDWRSVVESGEGLWFLGGADKLYALPRGQASPEFVGHNAEDSFAAGETVGAALDSGDQVLAWAVAAGASSVLVVRDLREGQWSTDGLPYTPKALVAHDDRMFAIDSAGAPWERAAAGTYGDGTAGATAVSMVAETGDVQAFGGVGGWGRFAGVELLGSFGSAATVTCEISYDSGTSWTSLGAFTVTGLSSGQAFQRQWYPAIQRGGKFRLRFTMTPSSTTAEGCRLTGFSLYYTQRSGPTRLDSAKRR